MMPDIEISFTPFIDFTLKRGLSKITKVKEIKRQDEYDGTYDFWRELREAICRMHRSGLGMETLDAVAEQVEDKKRLHYKEAVQQYKRFCRGKEPEWFEPGKASWRFGRLVVQASPDLGLRLNGQPHLIKLYFKEAAQKLQKRSAAAALALLAASHQSASLDGTVLGILNLKKSNFYPLSEGELETAMLLLEGEAAYFQHVWERLDEQGNKGP
ncbi:hypothetical protein [Paenibacillus pinihumi]|uniref:hypothetical protein n=1 Tax=Paenibacillus pinihumi TaxID=669462 RepID=UPI000413DCDF|nr:hypothetical protein [Paenibacillus pinihumi]